MSSLPTEEFLRRADQGCAAPDGSLPSPVIPHGYDRVAQWHMDTYGCKLVLRATMCESNRNIYRAVTREQLAMTAVLMSRQAVKHPAALTKRPLSLEEVLGAKVGSFYRNNMPSSVE